jgi:uncharacterized BrkB/YihY/UPF0761 family membrane protein
MVDGLKVMDETSFGTTQTELKICYVPLKGCDDRHIYENKRRQRFVAFERALVCTIGFLLMIVATIFVFAMGLTHEPSSGLWETFVNNAMGFGTALFLFFSMLYMFIALGLSWQLFVEGRRRA